MIFVLGMCVGSFINMAVYRTAQSYKVIKLKVFKVKNKDRSFCDYCGKQLHWYENIPIISWIALGGKTKCCKKKLSVAYPIVELGTGLLFLFNYELRITNYELILGFVVLGLMIFLMVFDGKYMLLPEKVLYILLFLGLLNGGWPNLMVGLGFGMVFWLISKMKIHGQEAMGNGDPYLTLFMGWWLGLSLGLVALYVAFITGAIYGVILLSFRKIKKLDPLPFGPFLLGATIITWLNSEKILYYLDRWF